MSQRQKRTRVHRGTQTEEMYFVDPLPHELTEDGEYYGGRELHERLLKAEEVSTVKSLRTFCNARALTTLRKKDLENKAAKGGNAGNQHFHLFYTVFSTLIKAMCYVSVILFCPIQMC